MFCYLSFNSDDGFDLLKLKYVNNSTFSSMNSCSKKENLSPTNMKNSLQDFLQTVFCFYILFFATFIEYLAHESTLLIAIYILANLTLILTTLL